MGGERERERERDREQREEEERGTQWRENYTYLIMLLIP